jgi:hypothetical protein
MRAWVSAEANTKVEWGRKREKGQGEQNPNVQKVT